MCANVRRILSDTLPICSPTLCRSSLRHGVTSTTFTPMRHFRHSREIFVIPRARRSLILPETKRRDSAWTCLDGQKPVSTGPATARNCLSWRFFLRKRCFMSQNVILGRYSARLLQLARVCQFIVDRMAPQPGCRPLRSLDLVRNPRQGLHETDFVSRKRIFARPKGLQTTERSASQVAATELCGWISFAGEFGCMTGTGAGTRWPRSRCVSQFDQMGRVTGRESSMAGQIALCGPLP